MLGTLMLVLFLCLFATVPIALSLGISTLGVFATQFPSMPMANNLAQAMITSADSFPLMAIPFFMLVGTLMEKTGIARRLVDFLSGCAYAVDGKIKKVAASAYLLTPYNVEIVGDLVEELENNGVYF